MLGIMEKPYSLLMEEGISLGVGPVQLVFDSCPPFVLYIAPQCSAPAGGL